MARFIQDDNSTPSSTVSYQVEHELNKRIQQVFSLLFYCLVYSFVVSAIDLSNWFCRLVSIVFLFLQNNYKIYIHI